MKRHKLILVRDVRAPWFFLAKDVGVRGGGATMRSIKHIIIIIYIIVIIINNLNVFSTKKNVGAPAGGANVRSIKHGRQSHPW